MTNQIRNFKFFQCVITIPEKPTYPIAVQIEVKVTNIGTSGKLGREKKYQKDMEKMVGAEGGI